MANQEHLDILKQGVEEWNQWRIEHSKIRPDLSGASLSGASLSKADFGGADLSGATLDRADLHGAEFLFTDLRGAILRNADLSFAILRGATLTDADFTGAKVGMTVFGNVDLRTVKGLDTLKHLFPSIIGLDTILRSEGTFPEVFLRRTGANDTFITFIHSLSQHPVEYDTCFISYSSKDQEFAEQLYADLQSTGIRCWFAPEDLKIGDELRRSIDESIRLYDKLIVILSQHSIDSAWVEFEVKKALSKEQEQGKLVLFPLKLDETVMETPEAWAAAIRKKRHIGDFSNWKSHDKYQKAFRRLMRALKSETPKSTT